MITVESEPPYLKFESLDLPNEILHFITTRNGGHSSPPRDSLNMSYDNGDDPNIVMKNRRLFFELIGIDLGTCVFAEQIHKAEIGVVYGSQQSLVIGVDGMVTAKEGLCLCIVTADCLPIVCYDCKKHVVGIAHAGWRGLALGIIDNFVGVMNREFGSGANDLLVGIGPCIDKINYEVGDDVISRFTKFSEYFLPNGKPGKSLLDLTGITVQQLINLGVRRENIELSNLSTFNRPDLFYSYRRQRPNGAMMTGVMLK